MIDRLLEASAAFNRLVGSDECMNDEFNISGSMLPPEVIQRLNNAMERCETACNQIADEVVRRIVSVCGLEAAVSVSNYRWREPG